MTHWKRLGATALGLLLTLGTQANALPHTEATFISDVRYEPSEHALYMPFEGPRPPLASIDSQGATLVIDIPRTGFPDSELFVKLDHSALIRAYVAAYDPEIKGLHLVVEGLVPLRLDPDATYRGHGMRFVLSPKDASVLGQLPPASGVVQHVRAIPRDGSPARTYTIGTVASSWSFPAPRLSYTTGPLSEAYAAQAIAGSASGVGHFDATWEPLLGDYSVPMRLGRTAYRLADPDYANVTHERTESTLEAAFTRDYQLGSLSLSTGVGYQAALTQVQTDATVASPNLFFAGYQVMHGPLLRQTLGGTLWGPLGAELDLGWVPMVFANIGDGTAMPYLTSFRLEPKLYLWPDQRVSLGYFYERTLGNGFNRESSGVMLGIGFAGF